MSEWKSGFVRESGGALTLSEGSEGTWQTGFLRDSSGRLVVSGGASSNVINATSYLKPGTEDNTAVISGLLDEANSKGLPLWLPPNRDIVIKAISKSYSPKIIPNNARLIAPEGKSAEAGAPNALLSFSGSVTEMAKTTAEVAEGSKTVPVSTTGISAGDLIKVGEKAPYYTNASEEKRYRGQLMRVKSIDSGSQLTVYEAAYHSFASNSTVWKVSTLPRPTIGWEGNVLRILNPNSATTSDYLGGLAVRYGTDINLNIECEGNTAGGVIPRDCYHGTVRYRGKYSVWINANNQFGYGVDIQLANAGLTVWTDASEAGPAATTNGYDEEYGEPVHCDIYARNLGYNSVNTEGAGAETHAAGRWIRYINPDIDGPLGSGFNLRCPDSEVIGGTIRNCGQHLFYLNDNCFRAKIRDNRGSGGSNGVFVQPAAARSGIDITDNEFEGLRNSGVRTQNALEESVIKGNLIRGYAGESLSGERYGIRFGARCKKTHVEENAFEYPTGTAANQAILPVAGEASDSNSMLRNRAAGLPGTEAENFPATTGWTISGNAKV